MSLNIIIKKSHTTRAFNGQPIKVRSTREEEKLCSEFGVSRYEDYRESFKNSKQRQALNEQIDQTGISVTNGDPGGLKRLAGVPGFTR